MNELSFSQKQTSQMQIANFQSGRCLKNLLDLINIDSPTKNIEGVFSVQKWVARELHNLGFTTQFFMSDQNDYAPLLVGHKVNGSAKTISLVMHADTVLSLQQYGHEGLQVEKGCLYGPGVIDNKGGIIIALEGLREFLIYNKPHFNIQVICVPNEEMGSEGYHHHLSILGKNSTLILGFEPALNNGDIISSRHG
ncbi:MAG: M20/M25/M40 family metallo-hydrolase, partial [Bdellovibrionales bacterium]|nr:M20/M25/M40 family metallo-hydrolase [Bdellovibrionales bacterium]